MATITGTITGISLVTAPTSGVGNRKTYLVTANFGVYTGAADIARLVGVPAAIEAATKNGKTFTYRGAVSGGAGVDGAGVAAYASETITNASGTLDVKLVSFTGGELNLASPKGVPILVVGDES
jgi:hypothetical protein